MLKCASRQFTGGRSTEQSEVTEIVQRVKYSTCALLNLVDPSTSMEAAKITEESQFKIKTDSPVPKRAPTESQCPPASKKSPAIIPPEPETPSLCPFCKQYKKKLRCQNSRHMDGRDMKGVADKDPRKSVHFQPSAAVAAATALKPIPVRPFNQSVNLRPINCHLNTAAAAAAAAAADKNNPSRPAIVGGRSHRVNYNRKGGLGLIKRYSVMDSRRPRQQQTGSFNKYTHHTSAYSTARPAKCPW